MASTRTRSIAGWRNTSDRLSRTKNREHPPSDEVSTESSQHRVAGGAIRSLVLQPLTKTPSALSGQSVNCTDAREGGMGPGRG
jgi:hypothetical protein